jgi:hypothetical protein
MSTPLIPARVVGASEVRARCPWCRREHVWDTTGQTGAVLFLRAQCRVKRALDAYGFPRVIALRVS